MSVTEIMNAKISHIDLGFKFPEGPDGRNFIVLIELILANKNLCTVELNPARLPEFMELIDVQNFYQIPGEYIQVMFEDNKRPDLFKPILATDSMDWVKFDNGVYFGSRIIIEEWLNGGNGFGNRNVSKRF